jgi:hypothetical protein
MSATDAERSKRGQMGIAVRLAVEDRKEMTVAARAKANWDRYYDQTDERLTHEERVEQAKALRTAHMCRMSMAAAAARRRRK